MNTKLIFFLVFLSPPLNNLVEAVSISGIKCFGATVNDLRIKGCREQPCRIRMGERLPFELDMSLKNVKGRPKKADQVNLNVFIPYYRGTYRTTLDRVSCESENLGFQCPLISSRKYTVKSFLSISPLAKHKHINQDSIGVKEAHFEWRTGPSDGWSMCWFKVKLNVVH